MLGSPIFYLKGMRITMFQLSGFYCRVEDFGLGVKGLSGLQSFNRQQEELGDSGGGVSFSAPYS